MYEHEYEQFIEKVKQYTGIDLAQYKETQMKRRLQAFYDKKGYTSFNQLYLAMVKDKKLLAEFLDRMTINVSEFYRNRKRWEVLEKEILPLLLQKKEPLKLWSAACSTGEEPYTLAMILSKYLPLSKIRIFATDIDESALLRAKTGIYHERSLQEIPDEMKKKYFIQEGKQFILSDEIKQTVVFQKQNLLADSFLKDYDLIICRNVLIYFTEEAKAMIYSKFSKALKNGGYLFVGSTEQIFNPSLYDLKNQQSFFYKKTSGLSVINN
ncbi:MULTISPECIES: CheR family methyltransferase [Cytobacillus]|uniref:protein-glutamate O-methyltransferase n=1 Tax=Cytobacillus stercorigallinarum TaxID=2762240 RepID=A0ABR8QL35_9BACI|nr:protein-glutamate O-methyltransferase CheR [Cytobacillus stercorigallinarum]MBD7936067.1 protein-glutamate O-methyltransferase CheR [Cytobacillus stercorigallinarum]